MHEYSNKPIGAIELLPYLFPASVESTSRSTFSSQDLSALLNDLTRRFTPSAENDNEGGMEQIVGPLIQAMASSLFLSKSDIGGGGAAQDGRGWRENLEAIINLTGIKGVASVLPSTGNWDATTIPGRSAAAGLEVFSLLGPFLRLSVFPDAFVSHTD